MRTIGQLQHAEHVTGKGEAEPKNTHPLSRDQPPPESSATVHCLTTKRAAYLRRLVSPAVHLRNASGLTPALRECQLTKNGTRVPTRQPRSWLPSPRRPLTEPPRRPCGPSGPHGPGVAFRHPRSAISVPGPHFGIRHSPAAPHVGITMGRLIRSTEAAGTHDIAAARATAIGPGLLDFHPQRASVQAPAAATSGVGSKRPVRAAASA